MPTRPPCLPLGACSGTPGQVLALWQTITTRIQIPSTCPARSTASAWGERWASALSASRQDTLGWATCRALCRLPRPPHGVPRLASQTPFAAVRILQRLTVGQAGQMTSLKLKTAELPLPQTGLVMSTQYRVQCFTSFYIILKSSFFIVLLLVMVLATVADSLLWTPAQSVIKPELPAQFAPQFFHSEWGYDFLPL